MAFFLGTIRFCALVENMSHGALTVCEQRCIVARNRDQAMALLKAEARKAAEGYFDEPLTWMDESWSSSGYDLRVFPDSVRLISPLAFEELAAFLPVLRDPKETLPESVVGQDLPEAVKTMARRIGEQLRGAGIDVAHSRLLKALAASLGKTDWQVLRARAADCAQGAQIRQTDTRQEVVQEPIMVSVALDCDGVDRSFTFDAAPALAHWPRSMLQELIDGMDEYDRVEEMRDLVELCSPSAAGYYSGVRDAMGGFGDVPVWAFTEVDYDAVRRLMDRLQKDDEPVAAQAPKSDSVRRILARFVPQAWVNDYAVDIDSAQFFDVTQQIFEMPVEAIRVLRDNRESTDDLCRNGPQAFGHNGPFRVEVTEALKEFFGVESLDQLTQEIKDKAFEERRQPDA